MQEERKLLSSASRTTEKTEMEIRRIDTAIEGLNVDIERIKSLGSNTELRVFRVWDGVGETVTTTVERGCFAIRIR